MYNKTKFVGFPSKTLLSTKHLSSAPSSGLDLLLQAVTPQIKFRASIPSVKEERELSVAYYTINNFDVMLYIS